MKERALDEIISFFKQNLGGAKDSVVQIMGEGIDKYLGKHYNDFAYTTTFLHRLEPVHIKDVYYPITIHKKDKRSRIKIECVTKLFNNSNFITISGDAGSGKSTALKYLFYDCINHSFGIPVFIKLRDIENETFEQFVYRKLVHYQICQNERIAKKLLISGQFLLMLDGYDEIKSDNKSNVIKSISDFVEMYSNNKYVLTTRLNSRIGLLSLFSNYKVRELNDTEVQEFISLAVEKEELASGIKKSINDQNAEHVRNYLGNPLLLSLYIITYKNFSKIPFKSETFYRRVIDVLFTEHDSLTKIGFDRELKSQLAQSEIEDFLEKFSFITYFNNEYEFTKRKLDNRFADIKKKTSIPEFKNIDLITDLVEAICLWKKDEGHYSFTHRSLQEYFAAVYISNLNKKTKISFLDKIKNLHLKGTYREVRTFLKLYSEIDEYNFNKYYALPLYNEYLEKFDSEDRTTKLRNFLVLLGKNLEYSCDEEGNANSGTWGDSYQIITLYESKRYSAIDGSVIISFFETVAEESRCTPELSNPITTEGKKNSYKINMDILSNKYIGCLYDTLFEKRINEVLNDMKKYIEYLKTSIETRENEFEDILDLIE